ncbi:MAG: molybdopterin-dependent oxidoreductase [Acidobacteriota bacterium]|nr:molybdopterin-dependent oxidoreductase [Acidobacteriota bacterium]MDQ3418013.1 molybdopterin-dependent oxidoreductase [Acidobacteriota bacterium]
MPRTKAPETWGRSTVRTACPLDCPDSCTVDVTVENGRIVKMDGGDANPVTRNYICGKVRRFPERVYGEDRLLYPAIRQGAKGQGTFTRVTWDEALDHIAARMLEIREAHTAEAILPFCYGGSNGLLTQDTNDAVLFRGFRTSRLARTVCAAPTGAANQALYGKMPGVTYHDYPHARLIVLWGVNPGASGIHLMPFLKEARAAGAKLVVIDPRATSLARQADLHLAIQPGADLPLALAIHRHLFENRHTDEAFLAQHTTGAESLRARAAEWTFERAADVSGVDAALIRQFAELYAASTPALVRCGWGLERNRNGGSAAAAILALPAVGGKFGVRGGGFSMSNSSAWGIKAAAWMDETPEPDTRLVNMNHLGRALTEYDSPPVKMLFVYNCNPLATMPDQNRVLQGLQRDDLFTVVYEQVVTDTCRYADVLLPATTFVENYDIARGYGPISLQLVQRVIEPVGEARPNAEVFSALAERLGVGQAEEETDTLLRVLSKLPPDVSAELSASGIATPPYNGVPVQFVDVFPLTPDRKVHLFPDFLDKSAPAGMYGYQPDPATPDYPLALISPASEKTVSSTLGELRERAAVLQMNPADAEARGLSTDDPVRVFNALGEVHCPMAINKDIRPGTVTLPKGLWRKSTYNGLTSNALVPDTLTDLGGGACFNDARVQVASLGRH